MCRRNEFECVSVKKKSCCVVCIHVIYIYIHKYKFILQDKKNFTNLNVNSKYIYIHIATKVCKYISNNIYTLPQNCVGIYHIIYIYIHTYIATKLCRYTSNKNKIFTIVAHFIWTHGRSIQTF